MQSTASHITEKITESYSSTIDEQERINAFLDSILAQKKEYQNLTDKIKYLSRLMQELSWQNDLSESDKVLIRGVIAMGKSADKRLRSFYIHELKNKANKAYCKTALNPLKTAIDNHKEDVLALEHIIFELREDQEFKDLSAAVDEL